MIWTNDNSGVFNVRYPDRSSDPAVCISFGFWYETFAGKLNFFRFLLNVEVRER